MENCQDRGTDAATALPETPRRARSDGWTRERQREFLDALARSGSVRIAAAQVAMTEQSAYRLRRDPRARAFAAAWTHATRAAFEALADTAMDRALNGTAVPIFYRGEQIGERIRYNDTLLMFLLRQQMRGLQLPGGKLPAAWLRGAPDAAPAPTAFGSRDAAALFADIAADPAGLVEADFELARDVCTAEEQRARIETSDAARISRSFGGHSDDTTLCAVFDIDDAAPCDADGVAPCDAEDEAPMGGDDDAPSGVEEEAPFGAEDDTPSGAEDDADEPVAALPDEDDCDSVDHAPDALAAHATNACLAADYAPEDLVDAEPDAPAEPTTARDDATASAPAAEPRPRLSLWPESVEMQTFTVHRSR